MNSDRAVCLSVRLFVVFHSQPTEFTITQRSALYKFNYDYLRLVNYYSLAINNIHLKVLQVLAETEGF